MNMTMDAKLLHSKIEDIFDSKICPIAKAKAQELRSLAEKHFEPGITYVIQNEGLP